MKTDDITPFTEHRRHLREHFERVKSFGQSLIVTTNGRPDAVLMSPERYEQLVEAEELLRSLKTIDKSMEDIAEGQTRTMRQGLREIANDTGIEIDR